jgi:hypothetical protein
MLHMVQGKLEEALTLNFGLVMVNVFLSGNFSNPHDLLSGYTNPESI